jgi:allantoin racemase
VTAAAVLDRLHTLDFPFDALVMAGFDEHDREGARELPTCWSALSP